MADATPPTTTPATHAAATGTRPDPRAKSPYAANQEKRRGDALLKQKAARQHQLHASRALTSLLATPGDPDPQGAGMDLGGSAQAGRAGAEGQRGLGGRDASTDQGPQPEAGPGPGSIIDAEMASGEGQGPSGRGRRPRHKAGGQRGVDAAEEEGSGEGEEQQRAMYGGQFMLPEWMTDVPADLGVNWYVMPRPEGRRCLLVSSGGYTVSRQRTGSQLHRMYSTLPEGGPSSRSGCDACILDCIYHEPDRTYYAQDLLMWRGHAFNNCTAEFRLYWLHAKLAEEGTTGQAAPPAGAHLAPAFANGGGGEAMDASEGNGHGLSASSGSGAGDGVRPAVVLPPGGGLGGTGGACTAGVLPDATPTVLLEDAQSGAQYRLCALPASIADPVGLTQAHSGPVPFVRDGLYFLHKEGHYQAASDGCPSAGMAVGAAPGASCPLALLWKDAACSRYLLDTDEKGASLERQQVTLEFRMDSTVATSDEPPVVLGQLPASFVQQMGKHLKPGRLLRFSLGEGGLLFHEGWPCGADLKYEGPGNRRRGRADQFSKIMFQYCARRQPITLEQLLHAAAHPAIDVHMGS